MQCKQSNCLFDDGSSILPSDTSCCLVFLCLNCSLLFQNINNVIIALQVKIAVLQYLQGLISLMDPSDFTNSGGIL